jgi:signal transduction histidine kinase
VKEKIEMNDNSRDKSLRGVEIIRSVQINNPNILDRILIGPLAKEFYLFSIFFGALICWFLIKILNDLDFYHPFTETIAKRIKIIAWLLIFTTIFHFVRYAYMYWRIMEINRNYRLEINYNTADAQSYKYGILLFIIYKVYLYGCNLQKDQDLTI